jgi:hypothetical protein
VGSLEIVRTFHRVAMDFTLRQVQCFIAVADTGQVSAAGAAQAYKKNAQMTDSFMEFRKFFRQEIGLHKNPET